MKRLTLSLSLALLTFAAGVAMTWGYYQISSVFSAKKVVNSRLMESRLKGDLEVEFLRFTETEYGKYAEFEVTNGSSETAYYWGYSKDSHCSDLIRQGRKVEQVSFCWCGTGLEEQSLKTGERAKFGVRIPDNKEAFEVGFDFIAGKKRLKRTVWSKEVERTATEMSNKSLKPTAR